MSSSSTRRQFLTRAPLAGAALPLALAALASCEREPGAKTDQPAATDSTAPPVKADVPYARYDPALPPATPARVKRIALTARDVTTAITRDLVLPMWTFDGVFPAPVQRVRVGDTVDVTLTNRGSIPHSIDFHAAQIDPKTAFRSIVPGETTTFSFTPRYPGAFMYHCGTPPVLMHIGMGMVGAIIVDPVDPLPPAREFVLVQSEFYVVTTGGRPRLDYDRMLTTLPDHMAFNGRPLQYLDEPIVVKRGERVRFYVVNAGPSVHCAFHVVGEQFDTVYIGAPPANPLRGVQTFDVAPGGGMIFELVCDVAGTFPFVNHAFGHGQKGAIGLLVVEP
ncbi:MAG TPA: multicopper oxidase domain-containing protein [Gemmatimonadales bacterium]|nr:multicopper oxidase domain-containing protein [Gemmatimonadales bacterium]